VISILQFTCRKPPRENPSGVTVIQHNFCLTNLSVLNGQMQYIQHCCLAAVQSDVDGTKHNQNISNPPAREVLPRKMAGLHAVMSANIAGMDK
jgi:hypothetical protein